MTITLKTLKGLEGLTAITDSDVSTGRKTKWEYKYALEKLLTLLNRMEEGKPLELDQFTSNGMFVKTVTFNRPDVYKYCKLHMLTVYESIADLRSQLMQELGV